MECTTPEQHREEKIFYDFKKNWLDLHEAQEKLLKEITCNIQCFSNEDQQKMVVKLFLLVSKNIFSN